jgi:hypothetical protein
MIASAAATPDIFINGNGPKETFGTADNCKDNFTDWFVADRTNRCEAKA